MSAFRSRDYLLLYGPPWNGPAQFSKHHLARYLVDQGHRVLYVEAPLGPLSAGRRPREFGIELLRVAQAPRAVARGLWTKRHFNPIPYHSVTRVFDGRAANRAGQRLVAALLRRDLARLGMNRPTIIAGLPHAVDALPLLPRAGLVYHCADDYAHVRGFPASLPELEAELCMTADLVVVTAETLKPTRLAFNPRTFWIPNGVDLAHFSAVVLPAEGVREGNRPVVGFVGGLAQWVDVELLAALARARPHWLIVLVGPVSTDLSAVRGLDNVHVLGPKPYALVPRYLAAMDVALIPFVDDEVTRQADPIKAYEYLASGVPVVATDIPALRRLVPALRVAATRERFLGEVEDAITLGRESGRVARQTEAARHTWTGRFAEFEKLVETHVPG